MLLLVKMSVCVLAAFHFNFHFFIGETSLAVIFTTTGSVPTLTPLSSQQLKAVLMCHVTVPSLVQLCNT